MFQKQKKLHFTTSVQTMSLKQKLSDINKSSKYLVIGHIKSQHKYLFESNTYQLFSNVPIAIMSLCIVYYDRNEKMEIVSPKYIQLSNKNTHIKKYTEDPWIAQTYNRTWAHNNNGYGVIKIPSNSKSICKWTFKLLNVPSKKQIPLFTLGLSSNMSPTSHHLNAPYPLAVPPKQRRLSLYPYYVYDVGDRRTCSHLTLLPEDYGTHFLKDTRYKTGDKIVMELDLIQRQLIYYRNDVCLGIAYKDIVCNNDIKYRFNLSVAALNVEISIESFLQYFPNNAGN